MIKKYNKYIVKHEEVFCNKVRESSVTRNAFCKKWINNGKISPCQSSIISKRCIRKDLSITIG